MSVEISHTERQTNALERIADAVEELATSPASSAAVQGIESAVKDIANVIVHPLFRLTEEGLMEVEVIDLNGDIVKRFLAPK